MLIVKDMQLLTYCATLRLLLSHLCIPSSALDIAPLYTEIEPSANYAFSIPSSQNLINIQGLGVGRSFYDSDVLEIQLVHEGPTWTFRRKYGSSQENENFVGGTTDESATCSLLRKISNDSTELLVGVIQDLKEGMWYEILPNARGENTVTIVRDKDIPKSEGPDMASVPELANDFYEHDGDSQLAQTLYLFSSPKPSNLLQVIRGLRTEVYALLFPGNQASPPADRRLSAASTPSMQPGLGPTTTDSSVSSNMRSSFPSITPSLWPSNSPSLRPTTSIAPSAPPNNTPGGVPSGVPSVRPSDSPSILPSIIPSTIPSASPSALPSTPPSNTPSIGNMTIVNVMVLWTQAAECVKSGETAGCQLTSTTENNMRAAVDLIISETNVAYKQSGIELMVNLTHAERDPDNYQEPGNVLLFPRALLHVSTSQRVKDRRYAHNAALVMYLVDNTNSPIVAGMAYNNYLTPGKRGWMFAVVASQYTTMQYVPAHEWGHNFGCFHDRGTQNACDDDQNTNWGYRDKTAEFSTIMAYNCKSGECDNIIMDGSCPRIQYFSGNATYQNRSLGGDENSCRGQIIATKDIVASVMQNRNLSCFSPATTVIVQGKGKIRVDGIRVGDQVLTSTGKYQIVYMMDHHHPLKPTKYLQIHTSIKNEKPLELTRNHMVFLEGEPIPMPAFKIRTGHRLITLDGPVLVMKIEEVSRNGLYNFLTTDGTIVADGIVTSTYSAPWGKAYLDIAGWDLLSYQALFDLLLEPCRFVRTSALKLGFHHSHLPIQEYETYNRLGMRIAFWWKTQCTYVQAGSLLVVLPFFCLLRLLLRQYIVVFVATILFIKWQEQRRHPLSNKAPRISLTEKTYNVQCSRTQPSVRRLQYG